MQSDKIKTAGKGGAAQDVIEISENEKGLNLVDKAMIFAVKVHSGSTRKGADTPYIVHPMEAGVIASSLSHSFSHEERYNIIAAAVLHDVLEDTPTTEEFIREKFGPEVLRLILSDTEDKRKDRPSEETWQIRKQETLDYLRDCARTDEKIIVFADKLSNLRSIYADYKRIGDELWKKFNVKDKSKHAWYYGSFPEYMSEFEDEPAYMEYGQLLKVIFG